LRDICHVLRALTALSLMALLIILAALLNDRLISLEMSLKSVISTSAAVIAMVMMAVLLLRVIILLPAVAVNAPGATCGRVMADTKGNARRVLIISCSRLWHWG
jgi:hypothetical protein